MGMGDEVSFDLSDALAGIPVQFHCQLQIECIHFGSVFVLLFIPVPSFKKNFR